MRAAKRHLLNIRANFWFLLAGIDVALENRNRGERPIAYVAYNVCDSAMRL